MIKFMDRSIWYYMKRPNFTLSLLLSKKPVRLYSLFVMDLIEQDLVEYDPVTSRSVWDSNWMIRWSDKRVRTEFTNSYIDHLLGNKTRAIEEAKEEDRVKNMIYAQLNDIEEGSKT